MNIVICGKQVLDPDAVNSYAIFGRLKVDPATKSISREGIPLLINAYDEQAIEVALRLRDAKVPCHITVMTVGGESGRDVLKHGFSMGADDGILITDEAFSGCDGMGIASILAHAIRKKGQVDLILCGRQASDDDQGIVGASLAGLLGVPCISIAKDVKAGDEGKIRVTRVLPDGDEEVEVTLPAVVTISNEVGTPRYPSLTEIMAARKKQTTVWTAQDLGLDRAFASANTHVVRTDLFVPQIQGKCQFIEGASPAEKADKLARILKEEGLI